MNDLTVTSQFDQLFGSEILTKEDLSVVSDLKYELVDTLKKTQIHRTRTEMEISVLPGSDGTY